MWGPRFHVVLADGSTRFIDTRRTSEQTIRLAINPSDGLPLPDDW
jgi:hypothetical protein